MLFLIIFILSFIFIFIFLIIKNKKKIKVYYNLVINIVKKNKVEILIILTSIFLLTLFEKFKTFDFFSKENKITNLEIIKNKKKLFLKKKVKENCQYYLNFNHDFSLNYNENFLDVFLDFLLEFITEIQLDYFYTHSLDFIVLYEETITKFLEADFKIAQFNCVQLIQKTFYKLVKEAPNYQIRIDNVNKFYNVNKKIEAREKTKVFQANQKKKRQQKQEEYKPNEIIFSTNKIFNMPDKTNQCEFFYAKFSEDKKFVKKKLKKNQEFY